MADYAVRLVVATRTPEALGVAGVAPYLAYGASPRASLGLVVAARALALLRGRAFALPEDVASLAPDLLRHRLVLSYEALADGRGRRRAHRTGPGPGAGDGGATGRGRLVDVAGDGSVRRRARALGPTGHTRPGPKPGASCPASSWWSTGGSGGSSRESTWASFPEPGSEPGESRPYVPGDDVRLIDWNVTARTGELHVRDPVADHEVDLWLLVDVSASQHFGTTIAGEA